MTGTDARRYSRQITLAEVGESGQRALADASVLVVGAGGLGSPVLHHLSASGVGHIGLVEFDQVDVSNLHRQTLYATTDIGRDKAEAAQERLRAINPNVRVEAFAERLDARNAPHLLSGFDVVVDGSDSFSTRYIVNDAAVALGIPNVYASVSQLSGQASVLGAAGGPCYRCLFPSPPPAGLIPSCAEGGVLGVVPALLGTIQATEALKLILGIGTPLVGRLLMVDALTMEVREVRFERDPDCPACGDDRRTMPVDDARDISVRALADRLAEGEDVALLDVREAAEHVAFDIGGRLIPLGMLDARAFELDDLRDREIVVYCATGGRSGQAARLLTQRGFRAVSLRGGLEAWREA